MGYLWHCRFALINSTQNKNEHKLIIEDNVKKIPDGLRAFLTTFIISLVFIQTFKYFFGDF